jgi:hypothetical protein
MPKKEDSKNLFFISQASKAFPRLQKELASIHGQFTLMIQLSNTQAFDGRQLLREANIGMTRVKTVDKDLRETINLIISNSKKLSRKERPGALVNLRGNVTNLEKKYLKPTVDAAAKLYAIANKRMKSELPDTEASSAFEVILTLLQMFIKGYKFYSAELGIKFG